MPGYTGRRPRALLRLHRGRRGRYDSVRQRTVLFGGIAVGGGQLGDTWEWDGKVWTQVKPATSPAARRTLAMAYDSARQRTVLFGGEGLGGYLADTWEYGYPLVSATFTAFGASCGPTLAAATNSRPITGTTFTMVTSKLPSTTMTALMSAGASNKLILGFPLPLNLDFMGMKGCSLYHSFDVTWMFPVQNGVGQFDIPIPNNPAFVGVRKSMDHYTRGWFLPR